jgi:carboxylate-amine ligase
MRQGLPGTVSTEFLTCQVEYATSPAASVGTAREEMCAIRDHLGRFASENDAVAAGTGTPFGTGAAASTTPSDRYRTIAWWLGDITGGHQVNGLHVHAEVIDDEQRVRALNALRPWLPVLLALSGNSPFWHERDTNYSSWRSILLRRLPMMGCPPPFRDYTDYRAVVDRLVGMGAALDIASLSWTARLSDRFPTVEVRAFDAQLGVDDALLLAALTRALVTSAEEPATHLETDALDTALWMAAREGLDGKLLHPHTGEIADTRTLVRVLFTILTPALQTAGDLEFVEEQLARTLTDGNGADRQRRAFATYGMEGLRSLLGGEAEPMAA